jgi:hypothetical protein
MMIAGAIGGSLVVLVGAWSLTGNRHSGGLPVVEAEAGPLRSKPADPGGMTVDGKDATILSNKPEGEPSLAPPPEAPALAALRQQAEAERAAREAEAARLAAANRPPAAPAPAVAAARTVEPAPVPFAPVSAAPAPAAAPQAERVALSAPPPRPPAPAERPAAMRPAEAPALRGTLVQLAAVGSESAAMGEWKRLERRMPNLLGGRSPSVTKVEHAGKTFYRLRTGGFSGTSQAGEFCAQVKAKGNGCAIAAF